MTEQEAKNLVTLVFENNFDRSNFLRFITNVLSKPIESKDKPFFPELKSSFQEYIEKYELVTKFLDNRGRKIHVLIVYLKKTSSFKARTLQRNFALYYITRFNCEGVLVAYVNPNGMDWRFSFVKLENEIRKNNKGQLIDSDIFTPAKRSSFLVGKNENSHTAKKQLLPLLIMENSPRFEEIEEAFSIEEVTKEFFSRYEELYDRVKQSLTSQIEKDSSLKEEFNNKQISIEDFSKKLLGQIVFLYFLQKKGWFGVARDKKWGQGPKKFLRELFGAKSKYGSNFFNDILEPLFYNALGHPRDNECYKELNNCRIPFLNGGLFEPMRGYSWETTKLLLPDDLFSNKETKGEEEGDGILDVFDRYNFTVNESDPLEKEIAVDPEMLGKVFESLLDIDDRKGKGAFYTPREIVHYMCQESLINYLETETEGKISREDIKILVLNGENIIHNDLEALKREQRRGSNPDDGRYKIYLPQSIRENAKKIDELLKNIKVCDPAVGSGAFPLGMINEIVSARNVLHEICLDEKETIYELKKYAIANSIHGVDIESSAVDIARLRLWLSLIVDQENPSPLPNLEHRIMQGDSLLEEYKGIRLYDDNLLDNMEAREKERNLLKQKQINLQREFFKLTDEKLKEDIIKESNAIQKQLKILNNIGVAGAEGIEMFVEKNEFIDKSESLKNKQKEFFETSNPKKKGELKIEVENLTWDLIEITLRENSQEKELHDILKLRKLKEKPFFLWRLNFSEVFKEKGGFDIVIGNPPYVGEKGHKEIFRELKRGNMGKYYQGKMDLFYFFFHLALDLAHDKANIAFITTNYYPTALGAKKLRTDLKERASIRNLINFNELRIFESASGQHNMITIFSKGRKDFKVSKNCLTKRKGNADEQILNLIISRKDRETSYYSTKQVDLYDGVENYIRFEGSSTEGSLMDSILEKIKSEGEVLGKICNVNQGIVTGADKLSARHLEKYKIKGHKGDGIFIYKIGELEKFDLKQDLIKPWYKNSDIKRYYTNSLNRYELVVTNFIKSEKDFPKFFNYLHMFKEVLINRSQMEHCLDWFDLHQIRMKDKNKTGEIKKMIFDYPKIVAPQRSHENTFGYNESSWYASADVYFITSKDVMNVELKYLLALLNSKLYFQWLYHRGKRKGEALELYQVPLSEIPIKIISKTEQIPFVKYVDSILSITSKADYDPENPPEKQKALEKEIDQMVYHLYGLTKEEIQLIESSIK